ncbi:MAG: hypothetical protein KAH57_07250, partial [Thermoplasmata archaeon]|nr:hypothetical protein [Thermoplasmata archaeon]
GPATDSYLISDVEDLREILPFAAYSNYSYIQTNDLDLSEELNFSIPIFESGKYNGNGHSIRNLYLDNIVNYFFRYGLFGTTGSGSSIVNLSVEDIHFRHGEYRAMNMGGLVGMNYGHIQNCSTSGKMIMASYAGGLVGYNGGMVNRSFSSVDMEGSSQLGGLVGNNYNGIINNSYSIGNVSGFSDIGGVVGSGHYGSIRNCYSSGLMKGQQFVGHIVGTEYRTEITSCFWNTEIAGVWSGVGGAENDPPGVKARTTEEMKTASNYIDHDWDFDDIWMIAEGLSYPLLKHFYSGPRLITEAINGSIQEDRLFEFQLEYEVFKELPGAENQLMFSLDSDRNCMGISQTGLLSGIPDDEDVGTGWVNVTITDILSNSDWRNYTIAVENINDVPRIEVSNIETAMEDELYQVNYSAIDPDPGFELLTWNLKTNATWLGLNGSVLTGVPSNDDVGKYWVNLTVTDGDEAFDWTNFTLVVLNVNDDPIITIDPITEVMEDETYIQVISVEDVDTERCMLSWSVLTSASFLTFRINEGFIIGKPGNEDVGTWSVNISIWDGNGGEDHFNYTLTVLNVNDGPELNITELNITVEEDSGDFELNLHDVFIDIDDDTLTFTSLGNLDLNISIADGIALIEADENWFGWELINFTASDGEYSISIIANVTVTPVNDPPFGAHIFAEETYIEGQAQFVYLTVSDPDFPFADHLTFTWSSNVTGEIGEGYSINLSLPVGLYHITVTVTDIGGLTTTATAEIEVLPDDPEEGSSDGKDRLDLEKVIGFFVIGFLIGLVGIFILLRRKKKFGSLTEEEHDEILDELLEEILEE